MKIKDMLTRNWQYLLGGVIGVCVSVFSIYFAYWLVYITEYSVWDWRLSEIALWGIRPLWVFVFSLIGIATVCYFVIVYSIRGAGAIWRWCHKSNEVKEAR